MRKKYYLAYGSNLNIEQMKLRCPTATVIGTGYIDGYELLFKGSKTGSYLTIEPHPLGKVPVGVWSVTEADEKALDFYEGFPAFYYKKDITLAVKMTNGRTRPVHAFVYIMHEDRRLGLPTRHYVDTCLKGYADFGFNTLFLSDAIERSDV